VVELRYGQVVALKIDAAETVDLKIEETGGRHAGRRETGRTGEGESARECWAVSMKLRAKSWELSD